MLLLGSRGTRQLFSEPHEHRELDACDYDDDVTVHDYDRLDRNDHDDDNNNDDDDHDDATMPAVRLVVPELPRW